MTVYYNNKYKYYEVRLSYTEPNSKRNKQIHKRGFKTKDLALRFQATLLLQKSRQVTRSFTVEELVEAFLLYKEVRVKERSCYDYKKTIDKQILPYFRKKDISKITVWDVENWQETILKLGYKNSYLESIQRTFSALFKFAIQKGLRENNLLQIVGYVKNRNEQKEEMKFWVYEEYEQFRSVIDNELDLLVFDTLYFTGMRIGELQARLYSDHNYQQQSILVNTNWNSKNKVITGSTKNGSIRTIYLPSHLNKRLQERRNEMIQYSNFTLDKFIFGFDEVIPNKTVENRKNAYIDKWNKLHPDKPLKKIRIHDFRHSHVSLLINDGLDSQTVAERLGHSREMVERVYSHLFPEKKRSVLSILDRYDIHKN